LSPDKSPLVLISGASSGIGQALALRYYQAGYRLALIARRKQQMHEWAQALQLAPERVFLYEGDVTDTDGLISIAKTCADQHGLPDIVIANAGISIGMDSAYREDIDVMARVFATNNVGLAATFHPILEAMRVRGSGRLVGIASVAGIRGLPGHGAYCASKAAVISYCESLRGELRRSGVRVITIAPGFVDTPLTRKNRYPMPFLLSAEQFADKAFNAIEAKRSFCVIPWQMAITSRLMRFIPDSIWDRLFSRQVRKQRANSDA
jgi:short-subunit dehydrogenase